MEQGRSRGREGVVSPLVEITAWPEIDIQSKVTLLEKAGVTAISKFEDIIVKENKVDKLVPSKIKVYDKAIVIKTQKA